MRVLIVGGGIGGLSAAVALTQRGFEVDVVERESTNRTTGAGITLYPNGERALRYLGLDTAVVAAGRRIATIRTMARDGTVLADVPAERWDGIGGTICIHRMALLNILTAASSSARVLLGVTVTSFNDDSMGLVASFTEGPTRNYDLVVGADGIRSAVRAEFFGEVPLRSVGQMYWRTAIDVPVVDTATMVFDDDRYVALMPLGGHQTYVALQTRTTTSHFTVDRHNRLSSLRVGCAGLGGPVPAALDAVAGDDAVYVGPAEEVSHDTWRAGRVVLIGDAAHGLSPVLTQGGSLAFEDAVILADELAGTDDIDCALDAFVARREPRVRRIRELTAQRIELLNAGDDRVDLGVATRETNAILRAEI